MKAAFPKPWTRYPCWLMLALAVLLVSGCGGSNEKNVGNGEQDSNESAEGPIRRDIDLSILGEYGPPLDASRVEVAPAKGWKPLTRMAPYMVRYSASSARNNPLPSMQITAEPSSFASGELTEENLEEFVKVIVQELKEQDKAKSIRPSNEPVAMVIGRRPCVRYVLGGRIRRKQSATALSIDKQILVTVVNGRRYTLELLVLKGDVPKNRDAAYAVFAGMKFSPGPAAAAPADGSETTDSGEKDPSK